MTKDDNENTFDSDNLQLNEVKVLNNIVENKDNYTFAQVSCFYKPIAIVMNSFSREFFDIFLFNLSFHQTFLTDKWISDDDNNLLKDMDIVPFINNVIYPSLGIKCGIINFTSEEDMILKIKEQIDCNNRVIVPGDLFELYYYENYKIKHHPHYFIIKGYDFRRKIFFILDSAMDVSGASKYKDFTIQFSQLYKLTEIYFQHYFNLFNKYSFYSFKQINYKRQYNILNALAEHVKYLLSARKSSNIIHYIEIEALKLIKNNNSNYNNDQVIYKMCCLANLKIVYYDILFKFLEILGINESSVEQLKENAQSINNGWLKVKRKIIYYVQKGSEDFSSLTEVINNNIKIENYFWNLLINTLQKSNLFELVNSNNTNNNLYKLTEKNTYDIEIIKSGNNISLMHSRKKINNLWLIQDNSPQFLIELTQESDFGIESKITVLNGFDKCYQSGIIVKLKNNNKFMFGLEKGQTISIFCPEFKEKCNLYEQEYIGNEIYLKVEKNSGLIKYYYKYSLKNEWINILTCKLTDGVECFGLFSKTWQDIDLKVELQNINYYVSKIK